MNESKKPFLAGLVIGLLVGGLTGAGVVAGSKASQVADDVHEVKQDFDKAKVHVAEDYKAVSGKAKEAVNNVDAKELGESATEGTKEVGRALKDRLIGEINSEENGKALDDAKAAAKAKLDAWKAKMKEKAEKKADSETDSETETHHQDEDDIHRN
jgi:hypothetical protein